MLRANESAALSEVNVRSANTTKASDAHKPRYKQSLRCFIDCKSSHTNGGDLKVHIEDRGFKLGHAKGDALSTPIRSIGDNMSPEDPASRTAQKPPLHRSLSSATPFYSGTPRPQIILPSHRPSLLRQASTPRPPAATPLPAKFSVIVGSSPPKGFEYPIYGSPSRTIKKRGRPFKNTPGSYTPPTQSLQKKGRSFKTPEAAAKAKAKAAKAAGASTLPKKRGRRFKYPRCPEEIVGVVPPVPKFSPFICAWKNCPAELHNLDTLQAHLHIVHLKRQPSDGPYVCLWGKCMKHKAVDTKIEAIDEGVEFETKEALRNHVKVAHLDHVARHQGDGPKTEWEFEKKPKPAISYSWSSGGPDGQLTPSVRNQPIEGGQAKDNNLARFRKARQGLYFALLPVENPEAYMTIHGDDDGDEAGMDELS